MKTTSLIIVLLLTNVVGGQYYGSNYQAHYAAQGGVPIVRNPGPMWPAHCTMCLGNHLISSHGYSYAYLNQIGYAQWQTLHDNTHNPKPAVAAPMIYAPTPASIIACTLRTSMLTPGKVFLDLGCGDGRVVVRAAWLYGCKAVGVDLDKTKVEEARKLAEEYGVSHLCKFYWADVANVQLDKVDVVYCYLEVETLKKLVPRFKTMKPGSMLISHQHFVQGMVLQRYDSKHELFVWTDVANFIVEE